jgi:hypothetical protein
LLKRRQLRSRNCYGNFAHQCVMARSFGVEVQRTSTSQRMRRINWQLATVRESAASFQVLPRRR